MIIVLPVCHKDTDAALRNISWARELDGGVVPFTCLISCESNFDRRGEIEAAARDYFARVETFTYAPYPKGMNQRWPRPQNWAWRKVALQLVKSRPDAWLWWEQDAVPLRKGWLTRISEAYATCGKPFMGAIGARMSSTQPSHLNGVAVYPPNWTAFAPQSMLVSDALPFDVCGGWRVANQSAFVPLIQHLWSFENDPIGPPCTFQSRQDLQHVSKEAVLFHRCKDGSLIECLRDKPLGDPRVKLIVPRRRMRRRGEIQETVTLFHSGDLGDIIYSLLFAATLGRVDLVLGPDPTVKLRQQMNRDLFAWIEPLLLKQPLIESVNFADRIPDGAINLNNFRKTWFNPRKRSTRLFECYAEHFQRGALSETRKWITVDPIRDADRPVVVARSARYRNDAFPWDQVASEYRSRLRFVGLPEEFQEWESTFHGDARYIPVNNALEMARVIAGSELFIGNQSFPMALALSLNVPVIQETCVRTPDCVFHRKNFTSFISGELKLHPLKTQRRFVQTSPSKSGFIELGPCAQAYGIGDTLSVVPVARALGIGARMMLPERMKGLAFLFRGACEVLFTEDFPVFPWLGGNVYASKLEMFGLKADPAPHIELDPLRLEAALREVSRFRNPVAFCPTCSRTWAHVRQRPLTVWKPILEALFRTRDILQFGFEDYPTFPGAIRMPFKPLEETAALYSAIGSYVGVNTGDYHLMAAVGGRCVVLQPDPQPGFNPDSWSIRSSRVRYHRFEDTRGILKSIADLKL